MDDNNKLMDTIAKMAIELYSIRDELQYMRSTMRMYMSLYEDTKAKLEEVTSNGQHDSF